MELTSESFGMVAYDGFSLEESFGRKKDDMNRIFHLLACCRLVIGRSKIETDDDDDA